MAFPLVRRSQLELSIQKYSELRQEFTQYKRRNEAASDASYQKGSLDAVREFLPVYDGLARALELPCADDAYLEGTRLVLRSMRHAMEALGITEIPALGMPFDPQVHEAVEHVTDPELGENIISRVVLTGFRQGDTVLRHALVVVAN